MTYDGMLNVILNLIQRKLQSFSSESTVPYNRDCEARTVDQAVIYSKILEHLGEDDEVYYNRGTHISLQDTTNSKYLSL